MPSRAFTPGITGHDDIETRAPHGGAWVDTVARAGRPTR
jgi:hypothetical protein